MKLLNKRITKDELIENLLVFFREKRRYPIPKDFQNGKLRYSAKTFARMFGSLDKAIKEADRYGSVKAYYSTKEQKARERLRAYAARHRPRRRRDQKSLAVTNSTEIPLKSLDISKPKIKPKSSREDKVGRQLKSKPSVLISPDERRKPEASGIILPPKTTSWTPKTAAPIDNIPKSHSFTIVNETLTYDFWRSPNPWAEAKEIVSVECEYCHKDKDPQDIQLDLSIKDGKNRELSCREALARFICTSCLNEYKKKKKVGNGEK